ncbi:XkdQ/YqbQ family protein [Schinkia azotoformans]|uniref:XkdQ/YqbQ family protein n=1 Tax=Schinkia azotoformans TaxID=1454 RepID=UPI002DB625DE|nr:hypothetical protein [Schinkia azotoformans]MEC1757372.1 hypothetical protein [Schinkia azotoformans]
MDNYTLFLLKNSGQKHNITGLIGNLVWKDSIDTLGMELSFDKAHSDEKYMAVHDVVELGDKLVLMNNNVEVFRGIITDESIDGRFGRSYIAFDYAFYLNKSKTIIQFNKLKGSDSIKKLCEKFSVPIGNITQINTLINKIYKDKTVAEIIKDILDQATKEKGIKYRLEMRAGKLHIEKYTDLVITAKFQPAYNLASFDVTKAIGNVSSSRSIQDMKNSIIITSSDEKSTRVYASTQDKASISKYGLIQDVQSADDKNIAQATNIAKNQLKLLNKITEDTSIELLGNDNVRAGRILVINEPITGLSGQYLVKECEHNYKNHIHTMKLNVEKVK